MNKSNRYNTFIKKEGVDQIKRVSYQVISRQLSPEIINKALRRFERVDKQLASHQRKVRSGSNVIQWLESGSPFLDKLGKASNTVNRYYKVSGLDTVETTARVARYSKSHSLANKAQMVEKTLQTLRDKIASVRKLFEHINDIQQQKSRQEEFADLNCPMNAIEINNQDDAEGSFELEDLEYEDQEAQERRNARLSSGWDLVDKNRMQKELAPRRKINGWVKTEGRLKSNLLEAINDNNDYKSQVQPVSEEEWVEWSEVAKLAGVNNKKDSIVLQYAKKGQAMFKVADNKVEAFSLEVNTIKELVEEVKVQLGYSLAQKGLEKARLDNEKLEKDLEWIVKWADELNSRVSRVNSYVKVGGKLADKIVKSINNIERHSEYKSLVKNPYAYNDKANIVVFEEELNKLERQKDLEKVGMVEEKPKGWLW